MAIGNFFWMIMVIWILFGAWLSREDFKAGRYAPFGGNLILFVLLFLLGWKCFGFIIQG